MADIVWLIPVLDLSNPSIRIRRYNVSNKMNSLGVQSKIISDYYGRNLGDIREEIGDAKIVVITQCTERDLRIIQYLKAYNYKFVFDHCEAIFNLPFEAAILSLVDMISCCSTLLRDLTIQHGFQHAVALKDAIEERYPSGQVVYENRYTRPKAVFCGMGGNSYLASDYLKSHLDKAGYDLVLITEWVNATVKWDSDTWPDDLIKNDVSLCPQDMRFQIAKSNNKVTTAMAFGMPVLASPISSYKEVINHGRNGFLCTTDSDWIDCLIQLKDPDVRRRVGTEAKKVTEIYSLEVTTKHWLLAFQSLGLS